MTDALVVIPDPHTEPVPIGWWAQVVEPAVEAIAHWEDLDQVEARLLGIVSMFEALDRDTGELEKALRVVERRRGELLGPARQRQETGRGKTLPRVGEFNIPYQTASRYRKIAANWDAIRPHLLSAKRRAEVTQSAILRLIHGAHVGQNTGNSEWFTPKPILEAARVVLGGIDLDPASTDAANDAVQAERYYTVEDDGLTQPWEGRVWMNPPYTQPTVTDFCDRYRDSVRAGDVSAGIVLVNNATETAWCRALVDVSSVVCFPHGRIRFWHPEKPEAAPLQGQAIFGAGVDVGVFRSTFGAIGWTATL